jgi:hypothetical protein
VTSLVKIATLRLVLKKIDIVLFLWGLGLLRVSVTPVQSFLRRLAFFFDDGDIGIIAVMFDEAFLDLFDGATVVDVEHLVDEFLTEVDFVGWHCCFVPVVWAM